MNDKTIAKMAANEKYIDQIEVALDGFVYTVAVVDYGYDCDGQGDSLPPLWDVVAIDGEECDPDAEVPDSLYDRIHPIVAAISAELDKIHAPTED